MHYSSNSPDDVLIRGCRRKDRLAQKYLYQRYYGQMLGICMRYTAQRSEAEDVLNRAFLKVFTAIHQYEPTGSFGGWIARIVFRTAIDYVRQHTRYREVMDYNLEKEPEIEAEVIDQLFAQDLFQIIQQLPATTRAVFSLYVIDGYKHREISELLAIKVNTSKWHLAEARKMLQQALKNYHRSKMRS
ncbi:MAG: sigma-70 family RNA polymerase sigma factor [Bacteroidota bacterium]